MLSFEYWIFISDMGDIYLCWKRICTMKVSSSEYSCGYTPNCSCLYNKWIQWSFFWTKIGVSSQQVVFSWFPLQKSFNTFTAVGIHTINTIVSNSNFEAVFKLFKFWNYWSSGAIKLTQPFAVDYYNNQLYIIIPLQRHSPVLFEIMSTWSPRDCGFRYIVLA